MRKTFENISDAAICVMETENAREKADQARIVAAAWKSGELSFQFDKSPPDRPARPKRPQLLDPSQMPKRGKAGSESNKRALLHAIAHIELNAIDLAFDLIARFGGVMPRAFTDDWVSVGDDEARHYTLIASRMKTLECLYGDLPAHDGLWQSALDTRNSLPARLAIVPMVLEARGLDVTPKMIEQFKKSGDQVSAGILQTIYDEEIRHVAAGTRWFKYLAEKGDLDPNVWFKELVQSYFKGALRGPFNRDARNQAGMPVSFYEPLVDLLDNA
ncbi:ferritin-like domain-containing protein [Kordiimonas pumila]|uniref:Ferritin-like domain-containing protein n=1 Tax=Kordiimonas pumila TaxID=2161677 RepID=A0ABV7D2X1_9PROT|nr:ferritin-like domain-containing protein [Kordiimonas pumila]